MIWDDLDLLQQREALRWHFAEVRCHRVPRLEMPKLEFIPAATHRYRPIEFRPVEVLPQ